jgi:enamine deaminase RidA (YjgF/YER057c/UK114 family)
MRTGSLLACATIVCVSFLTGCDAVPSGQSDAVAKEVSSVAEGPEYFMLRPEVEKTYGYTHAVRIGDDLKVSGAVSMDDEGNPTAVGNLEQQMKNAYSDLGKVLAHYGYTFDDVIVENVFGLPGLGRTIVTAANQSDYTLVQGGVLFIAVFYVLINLVIDIAYTAIDPRIRRGAA